MIAIWIRQIRSISGKYSREKVPMDDVLKATDELLSLLLKLSRKERIDEVVSASIDKFRNRINDYLPGINLENFIHAYPDYPKPGILFRVISPLLANPEVLKYASYEMARHAQDADVIA